MIALIFDDLLEMSQEEAGTIESYTKAGNYLVRTEMGICPVTIKTGDKYPMLGIYLTGDQEIETDYQKVKHESIEDVQTTLKHIVDLLDILTESKDEVTTVSNAGFDANILLKALALAKDPKALKDL